MSERSEIQRHAEFALWRYQQRVSEGQDSEDAELAAVGETVQEFESTSDLRTENAALLEVLEEMVWLWDGRDRSCYCEGRHVCPHCKARVAIRKARGGRSDESP